MQAWVKRDGITEGSGTFKKQDLGDKNLDESETCGGFLEHICGNHHSRSHISYRQSALTVLTKFPLLESNLQD